MLKQLFQGFSLP